MLLEVASLGTYRIIMDFPRILNVNLRSILDGWIVSKLGSFDGLKFLNVVVPSLRAAI